MDISPSRSRGDIATLGLTLAKAKRLLARVQLLCASSSASDSRLANP